MFAYEQAVNFWVMVPGRRLGFYIVISSCESGAAPGIRERKIRFDGRLAGGWRGERAGVAGRRTGEI
jgi:hypothetical protein